MNNFSVNLNLPFNPLKDGYVFPTEQYQNLIELDVVNEDFIKFIESLSLKVVRGVIFYSQPGEITPIHADGDGSDLIKMLWRWGGDSSIMNWYKPRDDIQKDISYNFGKLDHVRYVPDEVEMIHQQKIGFPSICQVGIPHNVTNYDEYRWVLCLIIVDPAITEGKRILGFDKSLEIFKDYLTDEIII